MQPLNVIQPVIENALVRMGQAPRAVSADETAKIVQPFAISPALHYLVEIGGKEVALSLYFLGDEKAKVDPLVLQLSQASNAQRNGGLSLAFHLQLWKHLAFFGHLCSGNGSLEMEIYNFMDQLFNPQTTGMEMSYALQHAS